MSKIWQIIKKEIQEILPAVIYFLITFNIVHLISEFVLEGAMKPYYSFWGVSLEALVVGKVMIIANALPFINAFPHKPLIYNIIWKYIIYSMLVFIFWTLEYAIPLYFHYRLWGLVWQHVAYIYSRPEFWASGVLVMFLLLVFVVFHELVSAVGRKKIFGLMFINARP